MRFSQPAFECIRIHTTCDLSGCTTLVVSAPGFNHVLKKRLPFPGQGILTEMFMRVTMCLCQILVF